MMKRVLGIGVALLVALGAGWVWGASGRSDLNLRRWPIGRIA